MARVYTNENFPRQAVEYLRVLGHVVETSHEAGNSDCAMTDADVLAYAARVGRVLVTLNRRHFVALHAIGPDHAGLVVCTFDPDFERLARAIHMAIGERSDVHGALFRVCRPS